MYFDRLIVGAPNGINCPIGPPHIVRNANANLVGSDLPGQS
jgi:hypothetical protein